MATIPDVGSFGSRPGVNAQRPVVGDQSGQIIARAGKGLGDDAMLAGRRIQSAEDAASYASGATELELIAIQTEREVQEMPDYTAWEPTFRETIPERMQGTLDATTPGVRTRLERDIALLVERGSASIDKAAFVREGHDKVARAGDTLQQLRAEIALIKGLDIDSGKKRLTTQQKGTALIFSMRDAGFIDAIAARDWNLEWSVGNAKLWIEGMDDPTDRLAALATYTSMADTPEHQAAIDKMELQYPGAATVLEYSRRNVESGLSIRSVDKDGNEVISTFLGRVERIEGVNDGRFTLFPTVWGGQALEWEDERERRIIIDHVKAAERAGATWPSADTVAEARKMEIEIHELMAPHFANAQLSVNLLTGLPREVIQEMVKAAEKEDASMWLSAKSTHYFDRISRDRTKTLEDLLARASATITKKTAGPRWAEVRANVEAKLRQFDVDRNVANNALEAEIADQIKGRDRQGNPLDEAPKGTFEEYMSPEAWSRLDAPAETRLRAVFNESRGIGIGNTSDSDSDDILARLLMNMSEKKFYASPFGPTDNPNWLAPFGPKHRDRLMKKMDIMEFDPAMPLETVEEDFLNSAVGGKEKGKEGQPYLYPENFWLYQSYEAAKREWRSKHAASPNPVESAEIIEDLDARFFAAGNKKARPRAQIELDTSLSRYDRENMVWDEKIPLGRMSDVKDALYRLDLPATGQNMIDMYRRMIADGYGTQPDRAVFLTAAEELLPLLEKYYDPDKQFVTDAERRRIPELLELMGQNPVDWQERGQVWLREMLEKNTEVARRLQWENEGSLLDLEAAREVAEYDRAHGKPTSIMRTRGNKRGQKAEGQ